MGIVVNNPIFVTVGPWSPEVQMAALYLSGPFQLVLEKKTSECFYHRSGNDTYLSHVTTTIKQTFISPSPGSSIRYCFNWHVALEVMSEAVEIGVTLVIGLIMTLTSGTENSSCTHFVDLHIRIFISTFLPTSVPKLTIISTKSYFIVFPPIKELEANLILPLKRSK